MEDTLLDIALRHQVYLERLKAGMANQTSDILRELDTAIVDILRALEVDNMAALNRGQLKSLLSEVRGAQTEVMEKALNNLFDQFPGLGDHEAAFEAASIETVTAAAAATATKLVVPVTMRRFEDGVAYKAALKEPIAATGEMLQPFLKGWSTKETAAVSNLINQGYANGWTTNQMIQAVQGTKKAGYTDGILARIDRNAHSVVHTSVQHVASEARFAMWDANADIVVGYRLIATLDSNTTPICRSLDRRTFPINEGPRPPLHIRCRTTTIAVLGPQYAYLEEGAMRSSEDGPIPAKQTYYDWLKTQPPEFQDSTIGRQRGRLLRDGGLTTEEFARLNLGRTFQPLTLAEMKALQPAAFKKAGVLQN